MTWLNDTEKRQAFREKIGRNQVKWLTILCNRNWREGEPGRCPHAPKWLCPFGVECNKVTEEDWTKLLSEEY